MRTNKKVIALALVSALSGAAQTVTPVSVTNFNLDAIAENTTAVSTTGGAIDGSDYVMYSAAYGSNYTNATGLPNSGLIAAGTRTYQLQTYSVNNTMFLTAGQTDSLLLSTPAPYAGLSYLAFATEGSGSMNITIRFTDNTTQSLSSVSLPDWFSTGNVVTSGFDRCNRTSGTPNYQTTQPKMFYVDMVIPCGNRSKSVKNIKFQNTGTNARLCIMAVSGASAPTFSTVTQPVTCSGGTNGSATISPSGGFPPFNYTVASTPQQVSGSPANLPTGVYSYTAQDGGVCPVTGTFAITQSLVAQPALLVSANTTMVCAGTTVTMAVSGAATYTWTTLGNNQLVTDAPAVTSTYVVSGLTSANCLRTGSIVINVNPLPVVTLAGLPAQVCQNAPGLALSMSPSGGNLTGPGVQTGSFVPAQLSGPVTVKYTYTDPNGCTGRDSLFTTVLLPPVVTLATPPPHCANAAAFAMSVTPAGGTFSGTGVSSGSFAPSVSGAGTFVVNYSYTDPSSCTSSATTAVVINSLTPVTFTLSKTSFCKGASSVPLNASPSTGSFSGQGVTGNFFSPTQAGLGVHTIQYVYTNLYGCSTTTTLNATVSDCSGIAERGGQSLLIYPNPSNGDVNILSPVEGVAEISDALGRSCGSHRLEAGQPQKVSLASGWYAIAVRTADAVTVFKVVIN